MPHFGLPQSSLQKLSGFYDTGKQQIKAAKKKVRMGQTGIVEDSVNLMLVSMEGAFKGRIWHSLRDLREKAMLKF